MNKPIRNVSLAVIVMIVALLANATYVQVFKADALKTDPRNNRVLLDEYSRQRGLITTSDGTVIALSVPIDSRLKFLRQYPREGAEAFAPVTGYYSFQYLASQIEHYENSILNGSDDRLFGQLHAPILRVASHDVPLPANLELEKLIIPDEARLMSAIESVMSYRPVPRQL